MANSYFYGLGRRKRATARVRLSSGKGKLTINDKEAKDYLAESKHLLNELSRPFSVLELKADDYDITAKVAGGGNSAQVDAVRLGISKALIELNEDFRATLRRAELLGRDPRKRERKKFGLKGARKKRQYTKR